MSCSETSQARRLPPYSENNGASFLKYRRIRSYKHIRKTIEINKKCLSAYDDKRYILPDGVHTLAHDHFRIADLNAQVVEREMEVDE